MRVSGKVGALKKSHMANSINISISFSFEYLVIELGHCQSQILLGWLGSLFEPLPPIQILNPESLVGTVMTANLVPIETLPLYSSTHQVSSASIPHIAAHVFPRDIAETFHPRPTTCRHHLAG